MLTSAERAPIALPRLTALGTMWQGLAGSRALALFALSAVVLQARGEAPFLYFQF